MTARIVLPIAIVAVAVAGAHQLDGRAIRIRGVVMPQAEWMIMATEDYVVEQLLRGGVMSASRSWQALRGDPVSVSLVGWPCTGDTVRTGQPLARVVFPLAIHGATTSSARLEGARARLRLLEAGPRPEEVACAEATARSAELTASRAATEAALACSLASRGMVAADECARARVLAEVAAADYAAALAKAELTRAGARPEDREALRAEIAALEAESAQAHARAETTLVAAPMDAVVGDLRPECLIVLQKIDTILVALPLDQKTLGKVRTGDLVEVTSQAGTDAAGRIVRLAQSASVVGATVSVAAYAAIPNAGLDMRPGMTVRAAIRSGGS
ncbi:hypothetical protein JXA88_09380 [Candidatus Fermentibacteria bacterium]|nr:hypothetical protein [Candidatus Fermentibacteria bacterium]